MGHMILSGTNRTLGSTQAKAIKIKVEILASLVSALQLRGDDSSITELVDLAESKVFTDLPVEDQVDESVSNKEEVKND